VSVVWRVRSYRINERKFSSSFSRTISAITSFIFRQATVGTKNKKDKSIFFPLFCPFGTRKTVATVRKQKMEGMNARHHNFPLLQVSVMWRACFYQINERRISSSFPRTNSAIT
jgi:hypothetical protein